jgi:hypothetical protein
MFSSPIFHIDKTFRAEISLFLGMKHFLFQPGIEPAPTSTWATRYSVRALNQLRYRGTHESLAQVIEVLSLHVLLVVRRAVGTQYYGLKRPYTIIVWLFYHRFNIENCFSVLGYIFVGYKMCRKYL